MLFFAIFKRIVKILLLLAVAVVIYFAVTLVQVWLTSRHYEAQKAGAIIVMGSAQYNGVPSPDLESRLNQALVLFNAGDAKIICVTGSKQPGDAYTEAESGAMYLESHGVSAQDIVEAGGSTSWGNIAGLAPELKARGIHSVLIATDPFHEDLSMAIASSFGFVAYPTPTQTSPIRGAATIPYFFKQAIGVGVGRIIGFENLRFLP